MRTLNAKAALKRYSLIELLVVIAALLFLINASGAFFFKTQRVCVLSSGRALAAQEASALKKALRAAVRDAGEPLAVRPGLATFKSGAGISIEKGTLRFAPAKGAAKSFALPGKSEAALSLEDDAALGRCLVLRLDLAKEKGRAGASFLRIVSALGQEGAR